MVAQGSDGFGQNRFFPSLDQHRKGLRVRRRSFGERRGERDLPVNRLPGHDAGGSDNVFRRGFPGDRDAVQVGGESKVLRDGVGGVPGRESNFQFRFGGRDRLFIGFDGFRSLHRQIKLFCGRFVFVG